MEEKIVINPGTDVKTAFLTWFFNQGPQFIVTALFCGYFAWKTHQLEMRLDACQNANVQQVVASSQSIISAVETLIGKMQDQERQFLNMQTTRLKK